MEGRVTEFTDFSLRGPWLHTSGELIFMPPDFDPGRRMQPNLFVTVFDLTPGHIDSNEFQYTFNGHFYVRVRLGWRRRRGFHEVRG